MVGPLIGMSGRSVAASERVTDHADARNNVRVTFQLSEDQIRHALALCERFPPRTGMYVSPASWNTIEAFLTGYVATWPEGAYGALQDFVAERLGPSPIAWTARLQKAPAPKTDRAADLGRERGQEAADVLFAVVRDFVEAQRERS